MALAGDGVLEFHSQRQQPPAVSSKHKDDIINFIRIEKVMKTRFCVILFLFSINSFSQNKEYNFIGKWLEKDDSKKDVFYFEFINDSIVKINLGDELIHTVKYKARLDKSPILVYFYVKKENEAFVLPFLIEFITTRKIKVEMFPPNSNPKNFSKNDDKMKIYLEKQ